MTTIAVVGSTFTYYLPGLEDQANPGLLKASPTIAAGDFTISINGGAYEAMDNTPTVSPAGGKQVAFVLSAAETTEAGDGGTIVIECSDAAGDEWFDVAINVPVRAADLSVLTAAGVTAAILTLAYEGSETVQTWMRVVRAFVAGATSGGNTASPVFKSADGNTNRIAMTVDSDGDRSVVTVNGA